MSESLEFAVEKCIARLADRIEESHPDHIVELTRAAGNMAYLLTMLIAVRLEEKESEHKLALDSLAVNRQLEEDNAVKDSIQRILNGE